jgi:hypothetical protein
LGSFLTCIPFSCNVSSFRFTASDPSVRHDIATDANPMSTGTAQKLTLESLSVGIPVIPEEAVGFYKQNFMVCFYENGHKSGVSLTVSYDNLDSVFQIFWTGDITEDLLRAYRETKRCTDFAACAIALILVRELTEFTAVEQSCIGTTIDYYLIPQKQESDLIFNRAARLEVSGILSENEDNTVENRISRKIRRLKPEGDLPDLIAVVEFSKPWSKMVKA